MTEEACLVGIADGTGMTKGRGRMAFDKGNVNVHAVSALSIERVEIMRGRDVPIHILICMNNSAGIFQIQETLGKKIMDSPLENYAEVIAVTSRMNQQWTKDSLSIGDKKKKVSNIRINFTRTA